MRDSSTRLGADLSVEGEAECGTSAPRFVRLATIDLVSACLIPTGHPPDGLRLIGDRKDVSVAAELKNLIATETGQRPSRRPGP